MALMFPFMSVCANCWTNIQEAGEFKMFWHPFDVTLMKCELIIQSSVRFCKISLPFWMLSSCRQGFHPISGMKRNLEENISNFIVSTVPADGLALLSARPSALPVMAKFESQTGYIWTGTQKILMINCLNWYDPVCWRICMQWVFENQ